MRLENRSKLFGERQRRWAAVPALALTGALAFGGFAVAQESPSPTDEPSASAQSERAGNGFRGGPGNDAAGQRGHGPRGMAHDALHGEFTVAGEDGGHQTMLMQTGEVTSVAADSITVRSADGYERTYAIGDDTVVNGGRAAIDAIDEGTQVRLAASTTGDDATALRIVDIQAQQEMREQRAQQGHGPQGGTQSQSDLAG